MSSPRVQQFHAERRELYKRAARLIGRAQAIVNRTAGFNRFRKYIDEGLPDHQQPQVHVIHTFVKLGIDRQLEEADARYDDLVLSIQLFLDEHCPEWKKLLKEEAEIKAKSSNFCFTIMATTNERRLSLLKLWVPDVITSASAGFSSDTSFLQKLGIAGLDIPPPTREDLDRIFLGSIRILQD